ncbi:MAG TPA: Ig-like domain-containing protein [Longimicrobiales bacterium]|nr:Ig-like domain-containing protein [Longimicrobiales bacterium]
MNRRHRWTPLFVLAAAACADAGAESLATGPTLGTRLVQHAESKGKGAPRSVTVSPSELSMAVGETAALQVAITDRKGDVSPDRAEWYSTDPTVATVDAAGLVTAVGAGSAGVVAAWRSASDTARVDVEDGEDPPPPPPPSHLVRECDAPAAEWIWCDDFESNRLAAYFEHQDRDGSFVRAAGVGLESSSGMRASWSTGQVSAGWLHVAFGRTPSGYFAPVDAGDANHREVYWRFFVRYDADWTGGGGSKLARARIFHAEDGWVQAMQAPVWSGDPPHTEVLGLDPVSYTDAAGAVTGEPRWLGHQAGSATIFADESVGSWYCIEAGVRLNDAGQANGSFRVWVDGALDAERTGLNWVGAYAAYGINTVTLDNYWNAGSPAAQSRYLDNLVVSTRRIGCG